MQNKFILMLNNCGEDFCKDVFFNINGGSLGTRCFVVVSDFFCYREILHENEVYAFQILSNMNRCILCLINYKRKRKSWVRKWLFRAAIT